MRTHYSEQLGRDYVDDDMLELNEVARILSVNSGREIPPAYVNTLATKGSLPCERQTARKLLFYYRDVRNYIVSRHTGRKAQAVPNSNALRQRKLREKRRNSGTASDDLERHRGLLVAV